MVNDESRCEVTVAIPVVIPVSATFHVKTPDRVEAVVAAPVEEAVEAETWTVALIIVV